MRLKFVDGLRGIAASIVVLCHLVYRVNAHLLELDGYIGVAMFFVLSGYVITMTVGDNQSSWRFLGRFAARRSLRLDPPYWASIATAIALMVLAARFGIERPWTRGRRSP
jgi:peptidoglycan/LPS O-acetylase OafA/YrhL